MRQKKAAEAKAKKSKIQGKQNGLAFKQAVINNSRAQAKLDETILDNSTRLFGIPHQFLTSADPRFAKGLNLGRQYTEKFIVEAPIISFAPGRPNYMPGMSTAERQGFLNAFKDTKGASNSRSGNAILNMLGSNRDVRFFNFHGDYANYMSYVNLLCRSASVFLGLHKRHPYSWEYKKEKKNYMHYDWSKYKFKKSEQTKSPDTAVTGSIFDKAKKKIVEGAQEVLKDIQAALAHKHEYVQFYVDPSSSFQETLSNSTGVSMLESEIVNGAEDLSKEIAFITRATGLGKVDQLAKSMAASTSTVVGKMAPNFVFTRLLQAGSSVIQGNNMLFPEIWKGSDYSKSYNITIKLTTPYGSKESIYLNIIVPLMHLISLAAPRQSTANTYTTPFLIKASSRGLFSCNMGIVDSLSIEKVASSFTIDGLPTEVVVQMSIKDLYGDLMITPSTSPILFFENEGLRDWVTTTCGLDVSRPYLVAKYHALLNMLLNIPMDIPQSVLNVLKDKFYNLLGRWW